MLKEYALKLAIILTFATVGIAALNQEILLSVISACLGLFLLEAYKDFQ